MSQTESPDTLDTGQDVQQAQWLKMYEQMLTIRHFEEHVNQLYVTRKMPGLAHLYSGEEAVAVGVCSAWRRISARERS